MEQPGALQTDAELVTLALGGDNAAFAMLYERYFDSVYDFLARMVRDRDEAADLAQDTFVRALNNLASLSQSGSFKSWLFTIARNTALNRLERARRVQPLESPAASGDDADVLRMDVVDEDRYGNPEAAAEVKSYARLVWEAAASLEPKQYAVLDLSIRQQLTTEEMAEALGVTPNNAYVMVNRMKKALESAIGALVLLREGRHQCRELDAAIAGLQVSEMTPALRRTIDRHAGRCEACSRHRRDLASPFGIFAGFGLLQPAAGAKAAILEHLSASFDALYDNAGMTAPGTGAPSSPTSGDVPDSSPGHPDSFGAANGQTETLGPVLGARTGAISIGPAQPDVLTAAFAEQPDKGRWRLKLLAASVVALLIGGGIVAYAVAPDQSGEITALAVTSPATQTAGAAPPADSTATATLTAFTPAPTSTAAAAPGLPAETPVVPAGAPPSSTQPAFYEPQAGTPTVLATTPVPPSPTSAPASPTPTTPPATATPTPAPCDLTVLADPEQLAYGTTVSLLSLTLSARGCGVVAEFRLEPDAAWVHPIPATGVIPADGEATVTVRIDRAALAPGRNDAVLTVHIAAAERSSSFAVPVFATQAREPEAPRGPVIDVTPSMVPGRGSGDGSRSAR